MAFDIKRHVIKVQGGREYLPVSARLVWFREDHPDWGIVTSAIEINLTPENNKPPYAIFQAQIFNAEGRLMATGTKMEDVRGFGDFLEKAETGAVGRALAMCGYGTQFAPELAEGPRLADSPYPVGGNRGGNGNANGGGYSSRQNAPVNNGGMNRPAPPQDRPMQQERPMQTERPMQPERAAAPERQMPQERPPMPERPLDRPMSERPAPPRPVPAARDEFDDAFEDESPLPASVATGVGNIAPPARPQPQGRVVPAGTPITRVREPEPDDLPPVDDEDDERDPFLDDEDEAQAAAPARPAPQARAASAPVEAAAPSNRCSVEGCGNVLTPPQLTLSMNKFGRPLCLAHQKEAVPAGGGRRPARNNADAALL